VSWTGGAAGLATVGKSIVGKVVVIEREDKPGIFLVKRVQKFHSGKYWVEGDANESTDSRSWGWIAAEEIVGVVLFRYKRGKKIV